MLAELLLVGAFAASGPEPGFGGASAPTDTAPSPEPSPGACMVRDERGAWVDCNVVLGGLAQDPAAEAAERAAAEARRQAELATARQLVAKMSDSPLAPPPPAAATAKKLTRIEEELAKIGRSPDEFPLAALRRDVERLDLRLAEMEGRGTPLGQRGPLMDERAELYEALQQVEKIAISRMTGCAARAGVTLDVKPYRMSAAGPVALTAEETLAALPQIDPEGCERFLLVDQALVDRVLRLRAVKHDLARKQFSFNQMDQRRALETEAKRLQRELDQDAAPRVIVPGASGL